VVHGDVVCSNEDLIRNAAYNWSPMSADEIREKTGIEQRRYTSHTLEEIACELKLAPERVRQIERHAFATLAAKLDE